MCEVTKLGTGNQVRYRIHHTECKYEYEEATMLVGESFNNCTHRNHGTKCEFECEETKSSGEGFNNNYTHRYRVQIRDDKVSGWVLQ